MSDEEAAEAPGTSPDPLYQKCLAELKERAARLAKELPLAYRKEVNVELSELPDEDAENGRKTIEVTLYCDGIRIDDTSLDKYYPWMLAHFIASWDRIEDAFRAVHKDTEKRMMKGLGLKNNENGTTAWDLLGATE